MSTPGDETTAVDTQGDIRAGNTAADAFNNFTSTIESVVAAALVQAGLEMMVNPMAETGMNPADFAYQNPNEDFLVSPVDGLKADISANKSAIGEVKTTANNAQSTADSAQKTADQAMSTAKQALSKASINQAVMDSNNETPPYVTGGGPQ